MHRSVLVFDGVCVLCSTWVDFVLRHDRAGRYRFSAMQTPTGRALLTAHHLDPDDPRSFLLLEDGIAYTDTDGILRVLRSLGRGWSAVAVLIRIVPRFIRDPVYRWTARNRYRIFGRHAACRMPDPNLADRFLP